MKRIAFLLFSLGLSAWLSAADQPKHPGIVAIAHIAYYVTDLTKARAYYEDFLGFEEAFALKNPDGSEHIAFVKINDRQFIELIAEAPKNHGFLHDAGFETDDARGLRVYLGSIGVKVPETVSRDQIGNLAFDIADPFGFDIQIVQYEPGSMTSRTAGKFMPDSRISIHIDHVGLLMGDRDEATKFYADAFGFVKEGDGTKMTIGSGRDRFELGFERKAATVDRYHVKDHICLSVPDVPAVTAMLSAKPDAKNFRQIENHMLGNGKHVAELYDLDGNRVELMEPPKTGQSAANEGTENESPTEVGSPAAHNAAAVPKSSSD